MQKDLDTYISTRHRLEEANLLEEKFLALLVELGELANETRCFKFWSRQEPSNKQIILEEYVDNIHFLLTIGLELNYQFANMEYTVSEETEEVTMFNQVFQACLNFYNNRSEEQYLQMFKSYLQLGNKLGFTEKEIFTAYLAKNEVNYERQDQGY